MYIGSIYRKLMVLITSLFVVSVSPMTMAASVEHTSAGITLTGNLVLADGKNLADGVALITHGTLAHSKMDIVASLQASLEEAGHSSLAINLSLGQPDREFMYDCKVPHRHRHQDAIAEIESWTSWLESKGAGNITVVGHSRGGNQTAWYASERLSASVKKVILIAPATWNQTRQSEGYKSRYKVSLASVLAKAKKLSKNGEGDSLMPGTGFLYCAGADVSADTFLGYYTPDKRLNTPTLLAGMTRPTLVVAASDDKVILDLVTQMQAQALPDNIRLEIVDGAGHFFRDLYGEDLADLIIEFLGN
jgi:pimeloyl-ACP methyl ester carboxylesterase